MNSNENVIEFINNSEVATVSFAQARMINKIMKLADKCPSECEIVAENKDGSICARIPVKWIKISPPKAVSEKSVAAAKERLERYHSEKGNKTSSASEMKNDFDILYDSYPKKIAGKTKAYSRYKAWVTTGRVVDGKRRRLTNSEIWNAINSYVRKMESEETELRFYKNFDTFMGDSILDYVEDAQ